MPWHEGWPWGGSLIHRDCFDAQAGVSRALDVLGAPHDSLGGAAGTAGPPQGVRAPWRS